MIEKFFLNTKEITPKVNEVFSLDLVSATIKIIKAIIMSIIKEVINEYLTNLKHFVRGVKSI
jgi:hypothetical protein